MKTLIKQYCSGLSLHGGKKITQKLENIILKHPNLWFLQKFNQLMKVSGVNSVF